MRLVIAGVMVELRAMYDYASGSESVQLLELAIMEMYFD
jgi:hypothetical protein